MVSSKPVFARRHLALVAFLGLVLLSGCADYPPDYNICLSCKHGIEGAAVEEGLDISVERSDLEIRVAKNGSSRWRVRSALSGEDVSTLASNSSRVDRIADRAVTDERVGGLVHYAAHDGNVQNVSALMENRTMEITFTVQSAGYSTVNGVVLVDQFHTKGEAPDWYNLGADRVVVRGPPGTVITNDPRNAAITNDQQAVIWERDTGGVHGETYIAFGEDRRWTTRAATRLAISANVARWVTPKLVSGVSGSLLLLVTAICAVMLHQKPSQIEQERGSAPGLDDVKHAITVIPIWSWIGTVLLACSAIALAVGDPGGIGRFLVWTLFTGLLVVPLGLFALLGWDTGYDGKHRMRLLFAIALVPFVMVAPQIAESNSPGVPDVSMTGLIYKAGIILMVLLGYVAFYIGNQIATQPASERRPADE